MDEQSLKKRVTARSPMHIMLLADDSSSMAGEASRHATDAIRAWINELYMATRGTKPYFRFSLVIFGRDVSVPVRALDVRDIDPKSFALDGSGGTTNLTAAFRVARRILVDDGATDEHCPPFVFLFTDGVPTDDKGKPTPEAREAALNSANELKTLALACGPPSLVTFAFGKASDEFLKLVATDGMYRRLSSSRELVQLLPDIGTPTVYIDEEEDDEEGTLGRFKMRIRES